MSDTPRKRGRPTTIDTQSAMRAVVELFRAKGFAAVSLDDLSEATGLSRPSLYRSFGDKLSMYMAAMNAFGIQVAETAIPALNGADDLETSLTDFFEAMLSIYFRDDDIAPGCLLFGTAPCSADQTAIRERLRSGIEHLDEAMRTRISEFAPTRTAHEVETAVQITSNTLIAFSARAKSGASKIDLMEMGARSAQAVALLLGIKKDD